MNAAQNFGFRIALCALFIGCFLGVAHAVSVVTLHVPLDPNEGWNAYFAQMAIATGSPYPPSGSFLVDNYPPLSFFLVGEVGRVLGDEIIAGRLVSLVSLGFVAFATARTARRAGCSVEYAAFAGLILIACLLLTSDYVGIDDPQMLGHAIAIAGMLAALQEPRTSRAMVASALLLTLAFFVKHNLVLLPASLALWLAFVDRRQAIIFMASGAVFLLVGLGLFREMFGVGFFEQVASARLYSLENIRVGALNWLPWAAIPIGGSICLFFLGRKEPVAIFAVIYTAIATGGGLVFSGGAGVDANAFFDADIALALSAALLFGRLQGRIWAVVVATLYVIPLVLLLRNVDGDWLDASYWLHPMADDARVAEQEIRLLHSKPDPVLCEMLSLCYWAQRSPQVDVFNMDQGLRTGARHADDLLAAIDRKRYSLIELESLRPFPLPPQIEKAIFRNYSVARTDDERAFLTPR